MNRCSILEGCDVSLINTSGLEGCAALINFELLHVVWVGNCLAIRHLPLGAVWRCVDFKRWRWLRCSVRPCSTTGTLDWAAFVFRVQREGHVRTQSAPQACIDMSIWNSHVHSPLSTLSFCSLLSSLSLSLTPPPPAFLPPPACGL
jgi:hypothetical protein